MIATNIIDEDAETEKNGTNPSSHGKRQNLIFKLGLLEKKVSAHYSLQTLF